MDAIERAEGVGLGERGHFFFGGGEGLVTPSFVVSFVEPRSVVKLLSIVTGESLSPDAIERAEGGNSCEFFIEQALFLLGASMVVAEEGFIGLFDSEDVEEADGGMDLKFSRVVGTAIIGAAGCTEFQEVLGVGDDVEGNVIYWNHFEGIFEGMKGRARQLS